MFAVLTYTDCAASESVSGRSGFQFRSASAAADPADQDRIRSGLLHVVPMGLDPERPDTHPPTCTYAALDGRYYLSRGRSTGRTLSGRPGNQLTRTIVTGSPADIIPLRPAQLFSATSWSLEPDHPADADGWQAPLEIDPDFETAALHRMVATDPWARSVLPAFLTMVEMATATPPTKLIINHPDQAVVMRWIALSSILEDGARALDLTFRVYSADPVGDPADIVGAHPDLTPGLTPDRASGCNLIDLAGQRISAVPVSSSAALHAAWFLDHDPYQALDAVETSRRWATMFAPADAAVAARSACLHESDRPVDPAEFESALVALGALGAGGQHDELDAYGDLLVDAVASYRPRPQDDIRPLTGALWQLNASAEDSLAAGVALAGLEWATLLPTAGAAWAHSHSMSPPAKAIRLRWPDQDARGHAAGLLRSVLWAAAEPDLAGWFGLADALDTGLPAGQAVDPIRRLAGWWAEHPESTALAHSWAYRAELIVALEVELLRRLQDGDRQVASALAGGAWDWLIGNTFAIDPAGRPLSIWLACRHLGTADAATRLAIVRAAAPGLPDWAGDLYLDPRRADISGDEIIAWLRSRGRRTMTPGLAGLAEQRIAGYLVRGLRGPLERMVDALRNPGVGGLTPILTHTLDLHARIWHTLGVGPRRETPDSALRDLVGYPIDWLTLYADEVAELLLAAIDDRACASLREATGRRLDAAVEKAVYAGAARGDVRVVVRSLQLMESPETGFDRPARKGLTALWDEPEREPGREDLRRRIPPDWQPTLQKFEATLGKGRRMRVAINGARQLFDRKERS